MANGLKEDKGPNVEFLVNFFNDEVYSVEEKPIETTVSNQVEPKKIAETTLPKQTAPPQNNSDLLRHKVGILVFYPGKQNIIAKDKLFLETVLKAVNISLSKTDIINLAAHPVFNFELLANATTENILAFGLPQGVMPKNAQHYKVIEMPGTKAIFAAPLSEIITDRQQKKNLWAALKQMFNVE